ncbi:hypothetical protein Clacol_002641 [Clathrus columnatus]|uniref:Kri1-like C-terminal domain-containing protein n=1 Tax=Clathrus columnatus TaxID=1419009 RepID=A0AAV5A949_9AGAM|nr:hypothetical protein Clacol_002641 [Clathrus columnatus]
MSVKYPTNTGRSFSFLDGPTNHWEQFDYRITSNASSPGCVTAVLTWQHGTYEYLSNGSLFLTPFGTDGFQQIENPCTAISNQITRYNQSIVFSQWRIFPLSGGGVHLNLYEFDGTPVAPMNIVASPPNMLPTQPIVTPSSTSSANARRDIEARSSASRSMYMSGSVALMVLFGAVVVNSTRMLSDSDSESDSGKEIQLTINEHFANAYAKKKEREELSKLKEKYGSDVENVSESDSEDSEVTEDEDGEELTPAVDAAILRTLARIKRRDPEIYNSDKNIFQEEKQKIKEPTSSSSKQRPKEPKPITIKQQALSSMLDTGSRSPSPRNLTYQEEQETLRAEVISAFHSAVKNAESDVDDSEGDDLLIPREKDKDEIERDEEEYREFLLREVGGDLRTLVDLEPESKGVQKSGLETTVTEHVPDKKQPSMKDLNSKTNSKRTNDEEFLMNYILNRGWVDRDAKRIPTYTEITRKNVNGNREGPAEEENLLQDDDEEFEEIVDNFESSYNFRFEEPGGATIETYPRNLMSTVRRQDPKRKEARERRKERKEEELNKKREEIKRLKSLKMKELRGKLEKIEKERGLALDSEVLANFDLDGDWDPEKHDQQMAVLYEGDEEAEEIEKPHWGDDIDIDDLLPKQTDNTEAKADPKKKKKHKKKKNEKILDEGGVDMDEMDADKDYIPDGEEEEWDGTEEMRKKKVQEYLDEIYGLEFNDIVGDIPTRFSYTQVAPQNYELTPAEILVATDAELNEYMGLKRLAPYRKDRRNYDVQRVERLKVLKAKLKSRQQNVDNGIDVENEKPFRKRKGKKERQRAKASETGPNASESSPPSKKQRTE